MNATKVGISMHMIGLIFSHQKIATTVNFGVQKFQVKFGIQHDL